MKIAYLASEYPARSHTFIRREMDSLRARGWDIASYSLRKCAAGDLLNDLERAEYDNTWSVMPVKWPALVWAHICSLLSRPASYIRTLVSSVKRRPHGLRGVLYAFFYFAEGIYLARRLKADGIGLLHVHFANAGAQVGSCAAEYLGIPWGLSLHGTVDFEYPCAMQLGGYIENAVFVRCVSHFGRSQAMRHVQPPQWDKLFVAYCGCPTPPPAAVDLGIKAAENPGIKLLSVGRLSPEKGQFLLLDAMSQLRCEGVNFTLLLVGDGPDRQALESKAAALGLEDCCTFVGAVEEARVFDYMRWADVLVCPSLMEGLPQVLMEAMALNVPVVAPAVAGIPELIADNVSGLLYAPADTRGMAEAIFRLKRDPELAQRLGREGLGCIESGFGLEVTVDALDSKLRQIVMKYRSES